MLLTQKMESRINNTQSAHLPSYVRETIAVETDKTRDLHIIEVESISLIFLSDQKFPTLNNECSVLMLLSFSTLELQDSPK